MKHRPRLKPRKASQRFNIGKKFSRPRDENDYMIYKSEIRKGDK